MDMYQKRKMRKEAKENKLEEELNKPVVNINWYERIYVPCGKKLVFIRY